MGLWPYYWYKIVDTYLPNLVPVDLPAASLPAWVYEWLLLALKVRNGVKLNTKNRVKS